MSEIVDGKGSAISLPLFRTPLSVPTQTQSKGFVERYLLPLPSNFCAECCPEHYAFGACTS